MPGWMTRKQVRSQPFSRYDETGLQKLLDAYQRTMERLNEQYLRMMGEHIRDIGTMWPSDVHRLQQIRRMNRNLSQLQRRIGVAAEREEAEIGRVFRQIAEEDERMARRILGVPDTAQVKDNTYLRRILEAQARETAGRMRNLSNTTVVSDYYRHAIDEGVSAVQSGVEDYGSAIRRVLREAGQSGLRVTDEGVRKVDYESGYSRRLDTAARMNILDGVRHLNQTIMEGVGREFGANGVEIDAHMLCAEDHLPYQGGQYSMEEFEEIQDSLQRPFGEWNCRHSWHPIMLGISPPTYTTEELERMERYSTEPVTIDGRTKTRYQWSQEMRRCETAIRQQKDTATLARYAGDDALRQRCQGTIVRLNRHYEELSEKAGLGPEFRRTYVGGFRDAKKEDRLTGTASGGTILPSNAKAIRFGDLFYKGNQQETDILGAKQADSEVQTIRTFAGLSAYMKSHYGVSIDSSVRQLRYEDVKQALSGLDEVLRQFPEAAERLTRIITRDDGVMSTTSDSVGFNPAVFQRGKGEAEKLHSMVAGQAGGHWIRNANVQSLGYHEAGHLLEGLLVRIHSASGSVLHWNDEWQQGVQAERIVTQACKNLQQTEFGRNRKFKSLREDISKYSLKSKSETLAEAVADCFRNGENAQPLSKEILRIVDDEITAWRGKK